MKKILSLKKYLTLSEAANYLSIIFCESVSEADILFFGINKELTLSINFINSAVARPGRRLYASDGHEIPEIGTRNFIGFSKDSGVQLDEEITYLHGVYDLTLWDLDYIYVLQEHQRLTNGPTVDLVSQAGAFVKRGESLFMLQSYFDTDERRPGSEAWHKRAVEEISKSPDSYLRQQMEYYDQDRKRNLEHEVEGYLPAWELPKDSIIVIRSEELRNFLKSVDEGNSTKINQEVKPNSKPAFLNIIGALCEMYWSAAHPGEAYKQTVLLSELEKYKGFHGMGERNLKDKLTQAMKAINS